jgi:DNA-binding IclR family transcriptional regulator
MPAQIVSNQSSDRGGGGVVREQRKNFAKSANRALDILEFLSSKNGPARAVEIADALGLAHSSAHQLLMTMVSGGYLICLEGVRYFPSPRTARIGGWLGKCYPNIDGLYAIIEEIHDLTSETVTLSMQSDCVMRIAAIAGEEFREPLSAMGWQVPVFGSIIGGAALADISPKTISRLGRRARRQRVLSSGIDSGRAYLRELHRFRVKGYASGLAQAPGASPSWSIAFKLPQEDTRANVVIGLAGPVARVQNKEREIVNIMYRTIRAGLRDIGGSSL